MKTASKKVKDRLKLLGFKPGEIKELMRLKSVIGIIENEKKEPSR